VRYDIVLSKIVAYVEEKELAGLILRDSFQPEEAIDIRGNIVNIKDYDDRVADLIGVKNLDNVDDFVLLYSYLRYVGISNITESATLISKRRWDLRFRNGLLVKLPAENWHKAIDILMYVNKKLHVLEPENTVVYIDLRIEDRMIMR
jgi:cell division septal protein FtsQ